MSKVEKYVEEFQELYEACKDLEKKIPSECGWKLNEVLNSYKSLYDRFCPFKVGDRVELSHDPKISKDNAPGWMPCRHFLIKGAKGIIRGRSYYKENFVFEVEFDDESWIDRDGNVRLASERGKHVFSFSEKMLVKSEFLEE